MNRSVKRMTFYIIILFLSISLAVVVVISLRTEEPYFRNTFIGLWEGNWPVTSYEKINCTELGISYEYPEGWMTRVESTIFCKSP
jgi:hypothetical protein